MDRVSPGAKVKSDRVPVTTEQPWASYVLEDGTVIRIRVVLKNIQRVVDHYTEGGAPLYEWDWALQQDVTAPAALMKPADPPVVP